MLSASITVCLSDVAVFGWGGIARVEQITRMSPPRELLVHQRSRRI